MANHSPCYAFSSSYQPLSQINEIAWNVFLPQLNRLNHAFEASQANYPSSEAKKIWSEARQSAAEKMSKLQNVAFTNYDTAFDFLNFLDALHSQRDNLKAYKSFQSSAREAVTEAGIAQGEMLTFREDMRIVVSRVTTLLSGGDKDVSSFIAESSQSLLELATGVEECNAILEQYRDEFKEVQRQSFDDKDNPPSEEEFQMVQEKWQAFLEIAKRLKDRWEAIKGQMRGPDDSDEPAMTSNNPTNSTIPTDTPKSHRIPFWRRFFQRISSCLSLKGIC